MAIWKHMDVAPTRDGGEDAFAFEASDHLEAPGNGIAILIPDDIGTVVVVMKPTGCEVNVEFTLDSVSEVKAGAAEWLPSWWGGDVDDDTVDIFWSCTAIRLVQVGAGTSDLRVRAQ